MSLQELPVSSFLLTLNSFGKARKKLFFPCISARLFVPLTSSKVLSFEKAKKKNFVFFLHFFSLIRTFAERTVKA